MTKEAEILGNNPASPSLKELGGWTTGLTKREYFAGLAMQGIISSGIPNGIGCSAHQSVEYADALLEELSKTE